MRREKTKCVPFSYARVRRGRLRRHLRIKRYQKLMEMPSNQRDSSREGIFGQRPRPQWIPTSKWADLAEAFVVQSWCLLTNQMARSGVAHQQRGHKQVLGLTQRRLACGTFARREFVSSSCGLCISSKHPISAVSHSTTQYNTTLSSVGMHGTPSHGSAGLSSLPSVHM